MFQNIDIDAEVGYGGETTMKYWCIGRVTYRDSAGRSRQTGFCRSFDGKRKVWVKEPESDYEYSY